MYHRVTYGVTGYLYLVCTVICGYCTEVFSTNFEKSLDISFLMCYIYGVSLQFFCNGGFMCNGCVYFYSDDGPFDPFVWGPWCHCLDPNCPSRGQINVSLSLNNDGVPGFRAAPAPRASFIPDDFV